MHLQSFHVSRCCNEKLFLRLSYWHDWLRKRYKHKCNTLWCSKKSSQGSKESNKSVDDRISWRMEKLFRFVRTVEAKVKTIISSHLNFVLENKVIEFCSFRFRKRKFYAWSIQNLSDSPKWHAGCFFYIILFILYEYLIKIRILLTTFSYHSIGVESNFVFYSNANIVNEAINNCAIIAIKWLNGSWRDKLLFLLLFNRSVSTQAAWVLPHKIANNFL